jgi:hypothetical protein
MMQAPELLAVLDIVEEDHELVLEKLRALKEAVAALEDPTDAATAGAVKRLRDAHAYFDTRFEGHMEEEERTLFPLLEQSAPGGMELVGRLRQEHMDIRRRRTQLGDCLQIAEGLEGGPPRMVLRDLLAYGWDLWEQLDNHAHAETRAVRQCLARSLPGAAVTGAS